METYAVFKDNIIVRVYETTQGLRGIYQSLAYEGISDYDTIKLVPNGYEGVVGMNIHELDENGRLRPEEERIVEGYLPVPKGKKIQDGRVVDKTLQEQIADGDVVVGDDYIYDSKQDIIRPKTPEEMYTPEELEKMRIEQMIQEEMQRIIKQQAIDNLVKAGKIVADELQKIVELENGDEDTKLLEQ